MGNDNTQFASAESLRNLSTQDFRMFGADLIVYVRPVTVDSKQAYGLYAADGRLLTLQESGDLAALLARHNGLEPVAVH